MSAALTDGADYTGVACCDWLLVNVQQTEMLQEGVSHAGIQLLALDEGVRQCHRLWVAPDTTYSDRENVVSGGEVGREHSAANSTCEYKMN